MDVFGVLILFALIPIGLFYWSYKHKQKHGLTGAMGWLLFFNVSIVWGWLIQLGDIGKFLSTLPTEALLKPIVNHYVNIMYGELLVSFVIGLLLISLIMWKQKEPQTPKRVIYLLWLGGPIKFVCVYLILMSIGIHLNGFVAFFKLMYSLSGTTMWMLYFKNSIRVKNTYNIPYDIEKQNKRYVFYIVALFFCLVLSLALARVFEMTFYGA